MMLFFPIYINWFISPLNITFGIYVSKRSKGLFHLFKQLK